MQQQQQTIVVTHFDPLPFGSRPICGQSSDDAPLMLTASYELVTCGHCQEVYIAREDRAQARWDEVRAANAQLDIEFRCVWCNGPRDQAVVFCSESCADAQFTGHDCVYDPDGFCMVTQDGAHCTAWRDPGWRPSGYSNAYRGQPYDNADCYEALTACDGWTNELNELARRELINVTYLLLGVVVGVILEVLYGLAEAVRRF